MPDIRIAKRDLFAIRRMLHSAALRIETAPCPEAAGGEEKAARRVIKQINRALKRIYGHDCAAYCYSPLKEPI